MNTAKYTLNSISVIARWDGADSLFTSSMDYLCHYSRPSPTVYCRNQELFMLLIICTTTEKYK